MGKKAKKKESKEKKTQRTEMKKQKERRKKKKKSLFIVAGGIRTNTSHAWQLSKNRALLTSQPLYPTHNTDGKNNSKIRCTMWDYSIGKACDFLFPPESLQV